MKLSIVLAALTAVWLAGQAQAVPNATEKAAELLARAWMIDSRCNVLDRNARDELTGFVARAEISLAEKDSVKAAKAAIAKGRAEGTSAPCDDQNVKFVHRILGAAKSASSLAGLKNDDVEAGPVVPGMSPSAPPKVREPEPPTRKVTIEEPPASEPPAMAAAPEASPEDTPAAKARKQVQLRLQQRKVVVLEPAMPRKRVVVVKLKPQKALTAKKRLVVKPVQSKVIPNPAYASTAEAYYRELRCRTLSQKAVNAMYAKVLREHHRAVAANGKAAVRQLLRTAQIRASGRNC